MSTVTVQLGQCGNQMGAALFDVLAGEAAAGPMDFRREVTESFFREAKSGGSLVARAALVDMEPKVVQGALRQSRGAWSYDPRSALVGQGGSGNNWAMGYCRHGPAVREAVLEGPVRREVEACDRFEGFLLLQSMAGGTGSGLGAYVADALAEEYPSATLLSQAVWPYQHGEVTVQSYNTVLTLARLAASCDGVVVTRNDALSAVCTKQLRIASPSFGDMNGVGAHTLAHALLPSAVDVGASRDANARAATVTSGRGRGGGTAGDSNASPSLPERHHLSERHLSERHRDGTGGAAVLRTSRPLRLLTAASEHLCCHPGYRVLWAATVPQMPADQIDFEVFRWEPLLWRLRSMMSHGAQVEAGHYRGRDPSDASMHRALAAAVATRGDGAPGAVAAAAFGDQALFHRHAPSPLLLSHHPSRFLRYETSASVIANSSAVLEPLTPLLAHVSALVSAGAYLHQYAKHGLEKDEVLDSLAQVEEVAERYRLLRSAK